MGHIDIHYIVITNIGALAFDKPPVDSICSVYIVHTHIPLRLTHNRDTRIERNGMKGQTHTHTNNILYEIY